MTNIANLAEQLAAACQADRVASAPAVRMAFRLALLNSTPHELNQLAACLQQEMPEGTASPWWNPAPLVASLRLYAEDLNRAPLALGGK